MLASSRTAVGQAAKKPFSIKTGARAVSAWAEVPQGPPVGFISQFLVKMKLTDI
jgi:aspartate aminotransferase